MTFSASTGLARPVVVSLPNAVGAVWLARREHGAEHRPEQRRDQRDGRLLIPGDPSRHGSRS
jgi:hypothetical protein